MNKSVEEMARELYRVWVRRTFEIEICNNKEDWLNVATHVQSQIDKAVLDGQIEEFEKLNTMNSTSFYCFDKLAELKSKRENLNGRCRNDLYYES